MRSRSLGLTAPFALAVAFTACASTPSPQEQAATTQPAAVVTADGAVVTIPTELVTVHPALMAAWSGKDPNAFQVYFTDNAVVVTPTDKFTGWHDIHMRWITPVLPGMSNFKATPKSFTREGAEIVETGSYEFDLVQNGKTDDVEGTYSQRWQKQADGTWRVVSVAITQTDD